MMDMLQPSDIPSYADRISCDVVPGGSGGAPGLLKHMDTLREHVRAGDQTIMIQKATATGKSRNIPDELQAAIRGRLLVVTTTTVDVVGMQSCTTCSSRYRMGHKREGGASWHRAHIMFTTAGLAFRWYASEGTWFLEKYMGILFDEMDQMEESLEFALLWEIALKTQSRRRFLVAGASATFSEKLQGKLAGRDAVWIRCEERPFPVESNIVEVPDEESRYRAANDIVKSLLRRDLTLLVFLPGKIEIANARESLKSSGIQDFHMNPAKAFYHRCLNILRASPPASAPLLQTAGCF